MKEEQTIEATVLSPRGYMPETPAALGDWLESCLHKHFTCMSDDLYGDGHITRDQRIALSSAIGSALDAFHTTTLKSFPEAYVEPVPEDEMDESADGAGEAEAGETIDTVTGEIGDATEPAIDDVASDESSAPTPVTIHLKVEGDTAYFKSAYAYTPTDDPSTWEARLAKTPDGRMDAETVDAAVESLHEMEIPEADLSRVKAKIRSAWHKVHPEKSSNEMPDSLHEVDYVSFSGDEVPLSEAAVDANGFSTIKVISPGWGSSGYYSREVLQRDGPKIFGKATHSYLDHPSKAEERDRPERSIKDLAAVVTETPWYDTNGPAGEGLYARVNLLSNHRKMIEEMAPYIGVSIRGGGVGATGTVEGRKGVVFERLTRGDSIDFVTHAGAGGLIVQESTIINTDNSNVDNSSINSRDVIETDTNLHELSVSESQKEEPMTDVETKTDVVAEGASSTPSAAAVDVVKLYEDLTRMQEAQVLLQDALATERSLRLERDAQDTVARELAATKLPLPMRERLQKSLSVDPPRRMDGTLDVEAFTETIREKAKSESEYLASILGGQTIRGMSSITPMSIVESSVEQSQSAIAKELEFMGISSKSAQEAAAGGSPR